MTILDGKKLSIKIREDVKSDVQGTFNQFPIRVAYGITIHKSQGKTFDKINIDIGGGAFAHGQLYVALSRCTTLEGISLSRAISNSDVICDRRILDFYDSLGGGNIDGEKIVKPDAKEDKPDKGYHDELPF